MKKITLLFAALCVAFTMNAQIDTSFETSEGYSQGDIYNQNGWTVTGDGSGGFVTNQVISDEQASDGNLSLKITQEPDFPPQQNAIVGAFYNFTTPLDYENLVISFDIYVGIAPSDNTSDFVFYGFNTNDGAGAFIDFDFQGNIVVFDDDGTEVTGTETGATWVENTWYNVTIEMNSAGITYYIDNNMVYQGANYGDANINQIRFVNDNYGGSAYIDNFSIEEGVLSVNQFEISGFDYFVNNGKLNLNAEATIGNVAVYSILGNELINTNINNNSASLDINSFNTGVYLAKVEINGQSKTFKFVKK